MKRQMTGFQRMAGLREMTADALTGVPLVEIMDDRRVLIEHHRGVVAYGCQEIGVRVRYGILSVSGSSLRLAHMTKEQIVICGCIESVRLIKETGGNGHGRANCV